MAAAHLIKDMDKQVLMPELHKVTERIFQTEIRNNYCQYCYFESCNELPKRLITVFKSGNYLGQ